MFTKERYNKKIISIISKTFNYKIIIIMFDYKTKIIRTDILDYVLKARLI